MPEKGEESPNFFDEQFDFQEQFDLLESAPAERVGQAAGFDAPPDEKTDREEAAEMGKTTEPETERRRSKRRRGRRGKKRRSKDEPKSAVAEAPSAERDAAAPVEPRSETPARRRAKMDKDAEPERRDDQTVRARFRGIPTWSETVGLVIDKNLEARAKRPAGGQGRGRGKKRRS